MRYIRNISDNQNKAGDTDNIFRFNLLQGEDIFNFGDYPISINIANSSGYILSMVPEKEFGNSVLKLDFNDQSLKSLTPDNYLLEVEVKFPDGTTATFPTKGGMPFTVNSNLKNTAGQLVPTVTFDTVLEAVDKKINNYLATVVKGETGETGPVGPTGEVDTSKNYTFTGNNTFTQPINGSLATGIISTATDLFTLANGFYYNAGVASTNKPDGASNYFVVEVIQTQYNGFMRLIDNNNLSFWTTKSAGYWWNSWHQDADDSTVVHNTGTETIAGNKTFTGTTNFTNPIKNIDLSQINVGVSNLILGTETDTTWTEDSANDYSFKVIATGLKPNQTYTFSAEVTLGNTDQKNITVSLFDAPISQLLATNDNFKADGTRDHWTFTVPSTVDTPTASLIIYAGNKGNTAGKSVTYHHIKLAIGNIATDWTPAQEDIAATVVHNTGTETVVGNKTFTGANTFTGQTSFWFKQIQWTSGIMQGTWYIQRMGNWVNAKFDMSANTGTGTTALSLPVGYRPISQFPRELEQGVAGIKRDGTIFITTSYTGSNAMTFSYPTNDVWPTA